MKKRILSMLLVVCMLMSMLPTAVFAAEASVGTQQELLDAIANASNGDTITLTGSIDVDMSGSGNGWGGVNVDANGSGSASFTMNSGSIAEDASVVIEGDAGDTTATTINGGTLQNVMKHPNAADAAGEDTITISGGTISGSVTGDTVKVTNGQIDGDVTGNQSLEVNGGTIGGTVSPVYQVTYAKGENVEVTGLGGSYAQGQTVTFTVTADGGYTLNADSVKAQTDGGTDVTVTDNKDGSFSFTMPAENVSVTVAAAAQPGTHTVTFMNGNNVAGTITVTDGDTITKANAPTLIPDAGYVFEGWFSGVGATGEQLGEAPVTVNADLVYYASFYSDNYTVHRNDTDIIEVTEVNGHPAGPTVTSQPQNDYLASTGDTVEYTVTPETGRKVANSVVKDADGNAVDIRTLDIDENGKITYQFTMPASNVTIDAQTAAEGHAVKFVTEDGLFDYQLVEDGQTAEEPANTPAKTGATFDGWYNGNDKYDFNAPVTDDLTLTAKFTDQAYAITAASDQAATITAAQTAQAGEKVTFTVAPAEGKTVSGATVTPDDTTIAAIAPVEKDTAADGTVTYEFTMPASNVTITATTAAKTYEVKYQHEDGTFIDTETVEHGKTITKTVPDKKGYENGKWYLGNAEYDVAAPVTDNLVLTAKYTVNSGGLYQWRAGTVRHR